MSSKVPCEVQIERPNASNIVRLRQFSDLPDEAYVSIKVVASLLGCGVSTVWRLVNQGQLVKPMKFGGSTRWSVGALRHALAHPVEESGGSTPPDSSRKAKPVKRGHGHGH